MEPPQIEAILLDSPAPQIPELAAEPSYIPITDWRPNAGPQEFALMQPDSIFEILYGGARGGGKTDAGIVWIGEPIDHPLYRGLAIRKNADDLTDWVDRTVRMYAPWGATAAYRPAEIRFPSGALIRTGHLKDRNSYGKYIGQEFQRILVEELTLIPDELAYTQLIGSCRSTVPGLKPQVFATTNPGNIGHGWVKKRFITGHQRAWPFVNPKTQRKAIFVPARVEDNPKLTEADPGYVHLLEGLRETDEQLWKAWRHGNWDVFIGQAFTEWDFDRHTFNGGLPYPLELCTRIMCFDWGYTAPGCMLWLAITPENAQGVRHVYCYRELWQTQKQPEEWGRQLAKINAIDPVQYMALPHDCFATNKGKASIAKTFFKETRIPIVAMPTLAKNARINRAALLHQYLATSNDGLPYLQVHRNCKNTIETIPELVHDDINVEDIDTRGNDHAYDALTGGMLTFYMGSTKGDSGTVTSNARKTADYSKWQKTKEGNIITADFASAFEKQKRNPGRNWENR